MIIDKNKSTTLSVYTSSMFILLLYEFENKSSFRLEVIKKKTIIL